MLDLIFVSVYLSRWWYHRFVEISISNAFMAVSSEQGLMFFYYVNVF